MNSDPVLDALAAELDRALAGCADEPDPPYFLAYRVTEEAAHTLVAADGACRREHARERRLQVDARVGGHALDSSRGLGPWDDDLPPWYVLPLEDDATALRANAWLAAAEAIRCARARLVRVRAEEEARAHDEERAGDLSEETPVVSVGPRLDPWDVPAGWDDALAGASAALADARIAHHFAGLRSEARTLWVATSEGTRVRESRRFLVLTLHAEAFAADGMGVPLTWRRVVADPARLPSRAELEREAARLVRDVIALRDAPRGEPYAGPVLLRGAAAGVWVHEVLGHRAEGHRIKDDFEGQTFRGYVGGRILPDHVDVWDDPTVATLAGEDLYGAYTHDDEGRPAERVDIVSAGVFRSFLMGRSPIPGWPRSNGHGRADALSRPVSRMGNTVLETRAPTPWAALRARLVEEARAQGLAWGLLVDDLSGGFTLTGRVLPNSFVLTAWRAWKVHVDGRPDELVRGLDLVGTPLACLGTLLAAGDDPGVFAGHCGAESGSVPVTAVAPSLLFARMEAQRQYQEHDAPPVATCPPPRETDADTLIDVLARARETFAADAHFLGLTLWRTRRSEVHAEHGALSRDTHGPDHRLTLEVRLGTPEVDNGGAEYPEGFGGSGLLPDSPVAVGAEAWRLLLACRREAARALAERLAALRRRAGTREPADFAPGAGVVHEAPAEPPPDADALRALARTLSSRLSAFAAVEDHDVDVRAVAGGRLRLDSAGTRVEGPVALAQVKVRADARAPDGTVLTTALERVARRVEELDAAAIAADLDALGAQLTTWATLPAETEEHLGPVLFEGDAAVALFTRLLLPGLGGSRRAGPDDREEVEPFRIGRRVLPKGFRVVDDPGADPSLPSGYTHDDEGVPGERVVLVEDGTVRGLYTSRVPGPGVPRSNGHGRAARSGRAVGMPAQVRVEGPDARDRDAILADVAGPVVIVRRFDADRPDVLADAVLRDAGGVERPVRGLRLARVSEHLLRDIDACGPTVRRTVLLCRHRYDHACEHEDVAVTVEAPVVLVGDVHLEPAVGPGTRPSKVPPPFGS